MYMNNEDVVQETYNQTYFDYQRKMGEFGGWANFTKFEKYIKSTDKVIDFGCGGGYLLEQINCGEKIGIEINDNARKVATLKGIKTVNSADDILDDWADVIISNHALEHTQRPLDEITLLRKKLRPGGLIIFIVPSEGVYHSFDALDPNHHLYTWSPMCIGNLFQQAGFTVLESKALIHNWPPKYTLIAKMGRTVFDIFCRIYGFIKSPDLSQSRVVAKK